MGRVYDQATFRRLPRERCAVHELLGDECAGPIHRHHVYPLSHGGEDDGRTVSVCAHHHPSLEALARRVYGEREPRRCPHRHVTAEARERCEARLNADVLAA
jgi:hypothetical protein